MSDKKISELPDGGAVLDTDEFVAARAGANVKIAGSAIGSGGSMPSWWTIDDDADTIDMAGGLTLSPASGTALTLQQTAAQLNGDDLTVLAQVKDADGNVILDIDNLGGVDITKYLAFQHVLNGPSSVVINVENENHPRFSMFTNFSDSWKVSTVDDAVFFAITGNGNGDTVEITPTNDTDAGLALVRHGSGSTGDYLECWDESFSNILARITPSGGIVATLPTSDPHVVGELWSSSGTVHVSAG